MRTIRLAALTAAAATAFTMSISTSSAVGVSHFGAKPIAKGAVAKATPQVTGPGVSSRGFLYLVD